jgi:hypothetical protein
LDLSGLEVEDSYNAPFTCHIFFVFFSGTEVGEALVGVFLVFVFFSPLALLIAFGFLVWWYPLNASTLGLVGAPHLSAHSLKFFYRLFILVSIVPPLV